jgi:hypothetical protein
MSDTDGTTEGTTGTEVQLPEMIEGVIMPGMPEGMQVIELGQGDDIGAMIAAMFGGPTAWRKGDKLPHLDFTDPPGGMTPEAYEEVLTGLATEAPSRDVYVLLLLTTLGTDLVEAHKVPAEVTLAKVTEFAEKVYDAAHPVPGYVTV